MTWGNFQPSKVKTFALEKRLILHSLGTAENCISAKSSDMLKNSCFFIEPQSTEGRMNIFSRKRSSVFQNYSEVYCINSYEVTNRILFLKFNRNVLEG